MLAMHNTIEMAILLQPPFKFQAILCLAFLERCIPEHTRAVLTNHAEANECRKLLMLIGVVLAHQLLTEQVVVLYPDATMTQLHIAYESSR